MGGEPALPRPAAAPITVRSGAHSRVLQPGRAYLVGRDPSCDIVVHDAQVSRRHAILRLDDGDWVVEDAASRNGTYVDGRRVTRLAVGGGCTVHLGDPADGVALLLLPADRHDPPASLPSVDRRPTDTHPVPTVRLRIGRARDNDLVLADLLASRHHAELRRVPDGGFRIVDLGSHNGTFVNGVRVTEASLTDRDLVGIGHATFRLAGGRLREYVDTGAVSFAGSGLTVRTADGRTLLDGVSFPAGERCLLAIVGPSGAGKSTLLGALTGMRPADAGTVLYDNRDLYEQYDELRQRIGYVPQEDVLHLQLTVRRALRFAADLRFPGDASTDERDRRVEEVIAELGLAARVDTRIESLSGGQRKRVSVALELLTRPSLLFLDEPTSGLDPGLDRSVMQTMRALADGGRTVVVVTHSVANLGMCDRLLVLAPGGALAFFGPPAEALGYFGARDWAEAFQALGEVDGPAWKARFAASPLHELYVDRELVRPVPATFPGAAPAPPAPPVPAQSRPSQLVTLCRRYLAVIAADRQYVALLVGLPIGLGLLVRAVQAAKGLAGRPGTNPEAETLLLVLVLAGCFAGAAGAVREIVKERPIYRRERATGLSPAAYLGSKVVVLGAISAVQVAMLLLIGLVGRRGPTHGTVLRTLPLAELLVAVVALGLASMVVGLLISALVSNAEKTMPLLVLTSMAQVVLSGAIVPLTGRIGLDQLSWLTPARWAMAATASTVDLTRLMPAHFDTPHDPLWKHTAAGWLLSMGVLAALAVTALGAVLWLLHRLDPNTGRRRAAAG